MLFVSLLFSCCLHILVNTQNVKFTVVDSSGVDMGSSATAPEGSIVQLSCSYDIIDGATPIVKIAIKEHANDVWIDQVICRYGADSNIPVTPGTPVSSTFFNGTNATCSTKTLDIRLRVKDVPKYYQCKWDDGIYGTKTSEITLQSYIRTQNVKFTVIDSSGVDMGSFAAALDGSIVQLSCSYVIIYGAAPIVTIAIKEYVSDVWIDQVICRYGADSNIPVTPGTPVSSTFFNGTNATCSMKSLDVRLRVKDLPKYYQCKWDDGIYGTKTSEITLQSYVTPTQPKVEKLHQDTPTEGSRVEYRCESNGRPPPLLRFSYDSGEILESELTYVPSLDNITDDSNSNTSIVTWTSNANKAMNGKSLKCEIYDHLSRSVLYDEQLMSVYYGPEEGNDFSVEWNLRTRDEITISCNPESNGHVTYQWFHNSLSNRVSNSQDLIIKKDKFEFVREGDKISEVYFCKAVNEDNGNKESQLRVTVNIQSTYKAAAGVLKPEIMVIIAAVEMLFMIIL